MKAKIKRKNQTKLNTEWLESNSKLKDIKHTTKLWKKEKREKNKSSLRIDHTALIHDYFFTRNPSQCIKLVTFC